MITKRLPKNENESNLIEKLVVIKRVTAVAKGGRRFSFSALVIVGDGKGRVGFSSGKAREVPDAIKKATERAKKSMFRISLCDGRTLHHEITVSRGASLLHMRPAPSGTGIIAGGTVRKVCEAAGLKDVVSKSMKSRNKNNLVRLAMIGLQNIKTPRQVALNRGLETAEIKKLQKSFATMSLKELSND